MVLIIRELRDQDGGGTRGRGVKRKQLNDTDLISISAKLFASAKQ